MRVTRESLFNFAGFYVPYFASGVPRSTDKLMLRDLGKTVNSALVSNQFLNGVTLNVNHHDLVVTTSREEPKAIDPTQSFSKQD